MTDRQTDGRTDGRTDRRTGKNNMSPDPVGGRHNNNMTTSMETRIYNLLIVIKMGHALDLKVTLTKE